MPRYEDPLDVEKRTWIHFEGRNPEVTYDCVQQLRRILMVGGLMISVECEKPERTVMAQAALLADVVFYSRLWAEVSFTWPSISHGDANSQ